MDDVRRQFETNVFGLVRMTQLVLPGMRGERHGRVVNISSMGGQVHPPGGGVYHATKYAVEAMCDALRFEVAGLRHRRHRHPAGRDPDGVRQGGGGGARPARTRRASTRLQRRVGRATREAYEKGPLKRLGGEPDDVAKAIEKAITAKRPPTRYRVTPSATLLIGQSQLIPTASGTA